MEQEYLGEQRAFNRQPFFRPVTLTAVEGEWQQCSAFSRDISPQGIGLLSNVPVERRECILTIPRKSGAPVHLRAEMLWCAHCGDGWYVSGGRFLGEVAITRT